MIWVAFAILLAFVLYNVWREYKIIRNLQMEIYYLKDMLREIKYNPDTCDHHFVSATNEVIQNGYICPECGALSLDGENPIENTTL